MPDAFQLPPLHPDDSVATLIDRLKEALRLPPDMQFSDEYVRIRAILRMHPVLKRHLPEFLRESKTLADYCSFMQNRYVHDYEADAYSGNALSQLSQRLQSGSSLDAYTIQKEIGWGGYGRVYLAQHDLLNRPVAIKFFQPVFHRGGGTPLARFFQEASMLFDLRHPNIIAVQDVGMYQERPFMVMDYFDGETLNSALQLHGAMPPQKAIEMAALLTDAMKHAHERNIVHRDLTPSNIMLKPKQLRVIDLGLGVYVEEALTSRLTRTNEAPAAGHYTARELLADPRLVDPRSDIYSIGAVWYTALTNEVPAGANLHDSLAKARDVPQSHRDTILRCLSDSQHRFASCSELLSAIHDATGEDESK